MQGLTNIGNAFESRANAGSGRRLQQSEEAVQGLILSIALLGETRETFHPKQVQQLDTYFDQEDHHIKMNARVLKSR